MSVGERVSPDLEGRPGGEGSVVPPGLPPVREPTGSRRDRLRSATAVASVAAAPMVLMLASVLIGGGPRAESADDALITLTTRDAIAGHVLLGPYSRFGWHHPGPSYFYLLSLPTWLWHDTPTGSWVGATTIGVAAIVGTVLLVRHWAGTRAGWWSAVGALAVVAGVGPGVFRDPWNPYVVTLPVLFVVVACALAAAGLRGTLIWAAVVGSFAVQTHVSTLPLVSGLLLVAGGAQLMRWLWRRAQPDGDASDHIPAGLPRLDPALLDARAVGPWWKYRPDVAIAAMLLVAEWAPPLWDQAVGTGNLGKLFAFFTTSHPAHGWASSWRMVTAMFGVTMFQHHTGLQDGVADPHPLVTTIAFVALALVAISFGIRRRREVAVWLGALGLLGFGLAVVSAVQIVGGQYRYLMVWMTVLPVLPLIGVAVALEGLRPQLGPWPPSLRPGTAVALVAVVALSTVALVAVVRATPAAALTDKDIIKGWHLVAPIVGNDHRRVELVIADGSRWPAAAGMALELERRGFPVRVDKPWTLLFGDDRLASGNEPLELILSTSDPLQWPPAASATFLGEAGPTWYFVERGGPVCWWGWVPFGGPACPAPVGLSGPAVPLPG